MRFTIYFNYLILFLFLVFLSVFFYSVDYTSLVDPRYYINATMRSSSINDALFYGDDWKPDYLFMLLSYVINGISNNFSFIGFIYSIILSFIFIIPTIFPYSKYRVYGVFLFLIVFNISFFGFELNIWRQGYAAAFVVLSMLYPKKRLIFIIIACFFHLNTAIFFVFYYFLDKYLIKSNSFIKLKLLFFTIVGICGGYFIFAYFQTSIDVYSNSSSSKTYLFRYLLCTLTFLVVYFLGRKQKHNAQSLRFYLFRDCIIYILFISMIFLIFIPAISERFMHYFFVLFPFFFIESYINSKLKNKIMFISFSIIYLSLMVVLIYMSSTYKLMVFDFIL